MHGTGQGIAAANSEKREPLLKNSFRRAMSQVAASVSVVTLNQGDGPHGTTVSAFTSLSMDPPMLMLALDRSSRLLARIDRESRLGLNVLSAEQEEQATRFAGKGETKFAGVDWVLDADAPRLRGCHAWVALDVHQLVPAGDHVVVLGDVVRAEAPDGLRPLTYHARTFGTHTEFAVAPRSAVSDRVSTRRGRG